MVIRRVVVAGIGAVAAIVLTGGSAFAFECYNANRSDNGNAHAAAGSLMSLEEILGPDGFVGIPCAAGVTHVIDGLDEEGFDTGVLINVHALMAGGLEKNGKGEEKLHDGQGIDHLSGEFFEAADVLIGEAFGICED